MLSLRCHDMSLYLGRYNWYKYLVLNKIQEEFILQVKKFFLLRKQNRVTYCVSTQSSIQTTAILFCTHQIVLYPLKENKRKRDNIFFTRPIIAIPLIGMRKGISSL